MPFFSMQVLRDPERKNGEESRARDIASQADFDREQGDKSPHAFAMIQGQR